MLRGAFCISEIHYGRGYVYSIQYHLVWCVKYRHDILYGHVDIDVKQLLKQIADDNNVKITEYSKTTSAIGIDLGITDFAILSDG
ncbi:hypothetical protein IGJ53_003058 [Enterococcus sp. DIV1283b]